MKRRLICAVLGLLNYFPEPVTMGFLGMGLIGLIARRKHA
jgi:hypothetical protein